MQDQIPAAALLAIARRTLTEQVVPGLDGPQRYAALMVANAIGIAAREIAESETSRRAQERVLAANPDGAGDPAALAQAIRAGRRDADADLHAALTDATAIAAAIWKPGPAARKG